MPKPRPKHDIITFKADDALLSLLQGVENRSEFIRSALLSALDNVCPLCKGAGVLTPKQKEHWQEFAQGHPLQECEECHEFHLTCGAGKEKKT